MVIPKSYNIPGAGSGKGKGKVNKAPKWESDNDGDEIRVSKAAAKPKAMPPMKPSKNAKRYMDKMAAKAMAKKKAAPKKKKK